VAWRRKQKFSEGAGSSDILRQVAERTISDDEMSASPVHQPVAIRSKEEMMFYRIFLERLGDESFPLVVGRTTDYPTAQ
jgi:asparagine synthase (glutamine-hydrolysing)